MQGGWVVNHINSSVTSVAFYIHEQYKTNDIKYQTNLLHDFYDPLSITDCYSDKTTAPAAPHLCLYSRVSIKFTQHTWTSVRPVNTLVFSTDEQTKICTRSSIKDLSENA